MSVQLHVAAAWQLGVRWDIIAAEPPASGNVCHQSQETQWIHGAEGQWIISRRELIFFPQWPFHFQLILNGSPNGKEEVESTSGVHFSDSLQWNWRTVWEKKKSSSIQLRGILFLKWCLAEGDGHCCHFRPDGDKLLVDFSLVGNTVGPAGPCGGWVTWAVEEPETEAFSETLGSKCFLKNYKLSCRYGKNDSLQDMILPTLLMYSSSSPVVISYGCMQSF